MTGNSTDSANAGRSEYFDLQAIGLGYLNRAREVSTRGEPFLAVDIAALHGAKDNVQYTRFDCIVRGKQAKEIVRQLMPELEAERSVLIGFRLGDLYVDTFTYTSGDKAGATGVSLKARLLKIVWAKVDGKTVHSARAEEGDADQSTAASEARESAIATARGAAGKR
jgi:hypothetical protein